MSLLLVFYPVVLSCKVFLFAASQWGLQAQHGSFECMDQTFGGVVTLRYHDHSAGFRVQA